jgi:anti-sigma B factor antagonist
MFEMERHEGTVTLAGRLDAAEAENARDAFRALQGPLVVDCARLDYVSSAGLGLLVEAHKRLAAAGQTMRLIRLQPRVRNVLAYAGLDRVLTVE